MPQELPFIVQVKPRPGFSRNTDWQLVEAFADREEAKACLLANMRAARGMRDFRLVTAGQEDAQ